MKKIKSVISIVIWLCIFSIATVPSEAESNTSVLSVVTQEDIQAARDAYFSLSPEAKAIFEYHVVNNYEILKFHQRYIDKNFVPSSKISKKMEQLSNSMTISSANEMTILMAKLNGMNLPTAVLYSLQAMGAGMVAAIADGILPIGDILLAAATASAAVVIALNWDTVSPYWDDIVDAFKEAFSNSVDNIIKAFNTLLGNIQDEIIVPTITVSGKSVTVDGVRYYCSTEADELTEQQKKNKKYFPAVLYYGTVYVDPLHSLDTSAAKLIMFANNRYAGVWATSESYARGLCGGANAKWHNTHDMSEGYFFHFHHPTFSKFHCWYLY